MLGFLWLLVGILVADGFVNGSADVAWEEEQNCNHNLESDAPDGEYNFVCDTTVPWLHYDGSTWAAATPPAGTGCHNYVFYTGSAPTGCTVGASCPGCQSPSGTAVKTIKLDSGCTVGQCGQKL